MIIAASAFTTAFVLFCLWAMLELRRRTEIMERVSDHEVAYFRERIAEIARDENAARIAERFRERAENRAQRTDELNKLRLANEQAIVQRAQRLQKLEDAALKPHVIAMLEADDPDVRKAAAVFAGYLGITGPLVERAKGGKDG